MLRNLIPFLGEKKVHRELDKIFSRKMLGAVLVGKFFGDLIYLVLTDFLGVYGGVIVGLLSSIILFVFWEEIEGKAKETSEKASEKASEMKEKADEAKDKASEDKDKAAKSS